MTTTQTLSQSTVDKLNNILECLHDSYNGYHESSQDIESPILKAQFITAAATRQRMIDELQSYVLSNADTPSEHGTVAGAAHRMFVGLKSLVTGKDTTAITNEVIRGETMLAEKYQLALTEIEPSLAKNTLESQLSTINSDLAKWKTIAAN